VSIHNLMKNIDLTDTGRWMHELIIQMYPICRSITGDGLRRTLEIISRYIPIETHEIPSGTRVFDWVVPREWNIRDAYIIGPSGEKIVDFKESNLHVLNYSTPVHKTVSLRELKEHLFTIPDHPDWIPYKTSYYREEWGFCMSHKRYIELKEGEYEVFIDSTLKDGSLSYGELYLQGTEEKEVLISCHACHPSLANDNLSGMSLAILLAEKIGSVEHRYSYRFLFIPGTIGAITWLAMNENKTAKIVHGLVLSGVGDQGRITYKKSRRGDAGIDQAAIHVLKNSGGHYDVLDFSPYGYDERQYCSPGFNLPVGCLSRTPYGQYPEYHTSADNLDFVLPDSLGDSFMKVLSIIEVLEGDGTYLNLKPKCEPQLGRRGLYHSIGSNEMAMLWVLNLSDGKNTLLDIAERTGLKFDAVLRAAETLQEHSLLKKVV
jgi:aminopeptidase-like protein